MKLSVLLLACLAAVALAGPSFELSKDRPVTVKLTGLSHTTTEVPISFVDKALPALACGCMRIDDYQEKELDHDILVSHGFEWCFKHSCTRAHGVNAAIKDGDVLHPQAPNDMLDRVAKFAIHKGPTTLDEIDVTMWIAVKNHADHYCGDICEHTAP